MPDQWTDRLSEYLDEELTRRDRTALAAHLRDCRECAATLAELRAVVARARTLGERPPDTDLWPQIQARIAVRENSGRAVPFWRRQPAAPRRISFSVPQLAAASILVALLSGVSAWLLQSPIGERPAVPVASDSGRTGSGRAAPEMRPANFADAQFDAAVADLQRALERDRGRLDPRTIEILQRNLAIIDRAIQEARQALLSDPANTYLNSHLAEARRRKIDLLREAAALADRSS